MVLRSTLHTISTPQLRRLLFASLCLLLFTVTVFSTPSVTAQEAPDPVVAAQGGNPRGMLIIYLVGDDGKPVSASGTVTIFRAGEVSGSNQMTSSGIARFSSLANAAYTVITSVSGYRDARVETEITPGHSVSEVKVTLERMADDSAQQGDAKGIVLAPKAKKEAQEGIDAMRAGHYDEAEKHLKAAYDLAPGNPDVNDRMAELFLMTKSYDRAQSYLETALSIEPDNVSALTDMGWLHVQRGDSAAAESVLQRATTLSPNRWFAHWLLGVAYLRQHNYEQARVEATTAIKVGKGAAIDAEYLLGESLAAQGRRDEAIKALQDFLRDGPDNSDAAAAQTLIANLRMGAMNGSSRTPASNVSKDENHP